MGNIAYQKAISRCIHAYLPTTDVGLLTSCTYPRRVGLDKQSLPTQAGKPLIFHQWAQADASLYSRTLKGGGGWCKM